MSRLCGVCTHPQRNEIDIALFKHAMGYRTLAARYGLSYSGVRRHEHNHLNLSWELSKGLGAMLSGDNLLEKIGQWHERMEQQYTNADAAGNIMGAVATARTGLSAIDSYAKITVETELQREVAELESQIQALQNPTETNQ